MLITTHCGFGCLDFFIHRDVNDISQNIYSYIHPFWDCRCFPFQKRSPSFLFAPSKNNPHAFSCAMQDEATAKKKKKKKKRQERENKKKEKKKEKKKKKKKEGRRRYSVVSA